MELTQKALGRGPRGLTTNRRGAILIAALCAIAAAGIFVFALNKYRQSVDSGNRPETVFVASSLIQKGTSGSAIAADELFKPTTIVAKQVSAGAIADAAALQGKVAAANIYPGQQLTAADFVPSGGLTATLGPNERAVSVPVQPAPGLLGNLHPGDHVDIYGGFLKDADGRQTPLVRLIASNIRVLQIGSGSGGIGSGGGQSIVTLALDDSQVPIVMFSAGGSQSGGAQSGALWLALRPGNASNPKPGQIATLDSILLGNPVAAGSAQ